MSLELLTTQFSTDYNYQYNFIHQTQVKHINIKDKIT